MKKEVLSAVNFLVDLIRINSSNLTEEQLDKFRHHVCECLWQHYENHWFPEFPERGSGYRCIRINGKLDPLIERAGKLVGLKGTILRASFPSELTMWVDPSEVAYRIGENGSICNIMDKVAKGEKRPEESTPVKATPPKHQPPSSPQFNPVAQLKHQGPQKHFQAFSPSRPISGGASPSGRTTYYSPPRSPVLEFPPQSRRSQTNAFNNNFSNCKDSLRGPGFESPRMAERLFVSS